MLLALCSRCAGGLGFYNRAWKIHYPTLFQILKMGARACRIPTAPCPDSPPSEIAFWRVESGAVGILLV